MDTIDGQLTSAAAVTAAPFCNACGASFEDDDRFCADCGSRRMAIPTVPAGPPWLLETVVTPIPAPTLTLLPAAWNRPFSSPPPPARKRAGWPWILLVLCVLAATAALWAIVSAGTSNGRQAPAPTHTISGSVLIHQPANFSRFGTICAGRAAMADMVTGAFVAIGDPDVPVITSTTLGPGILTPEGNCRLRYTAVVPERDTYLVVIGDRPVFAVTAEQLRASGWTNTRDWDFQGNRI